MATSENLGLYLPTRDDYISVKRDISDNMEIIDEAVGNNTNNIILLNNKTDTITSTQTSIVGLISSISGDGMQTFYYENASSLTDYPTVLTNLGAIYRAYITIKKYVAVAEISITAVLVNGHPVTVTGVNINTVNYWEDTLDTLDNKISIQYDPTPYTTLNQIKAFLNSVNSSLSDNQWKEVRFNIGGTNINPFGSWTSYSGKLTRFTSTVFICEVLNISGNEIQICRDGDTWNIVSINSNITANYVKMTKYEDYLNANGSKTYTLSSNTKIAFIIVNNGNGTNAVWVIGFRSNAEIGITQLSSGTSYSTITTSGMTFTVACTYAARVTVLVY